LQHPGRPNDAFIFTVLPAGDYLPALMADFQSIAKKAFKDIQKVSEPMLRLLSDKRLFTFCFVIDPARVITRDVSTVQGMLDRNIARLNAKPDASVRGENIKKLKAVRRKATAEGFNVRLFDNIIVAATLAGFISYLICKFRRAAPIGWFSDRDSITAAHEAFAHPGPMLGVNAPVAHNVQVLRLVFRIENELLSVFSQSIAVTRR
jgi:hypothetical protein